MTDWDEIIRERVKYDPDTGSISHRRRCPEKYGDKWAAWWNTTKAGNIIGKKDKDGYICVEFTINGDRKSFRAHRVGWFLFYGNWPITYLDHKNGLRDDNRIDNLQETSHSDNRKNSLKRTVTTEDGVFFNHKAQKWIAYVYVVYSGVGRKRHLGHFDTEVEAWDWLQAYQNQL